MTNSMTIPTQRLTLKPPQPADSDAFHRITNDYDVLKMTGTLAHPFTHDMAVAKIASMIDFDPDFGAAFCIFMGKDFIGDFIGDLIGCITIKSAEKTKTFEIGYHIGKLWWGSGYVSEALGAVIPWSFARWGHDIILEAGHFADNPASARVLEKSGFLLKKDKSEVYCTTRDQMLVSVDYQLSYEQWEAHISG